MSKIICDICGTSYPETAAQCPICGCIRPGDVQRITNEVKSDGTVASGYTYVKGGRFSKSNVKKRVQSNSKDTPSSKTQTYHKDNKSSQKSNRGLVITAIVLLLLIIAVVIYIALRFFAPLSVPGKDNNNPSNNTGSGNSQTADSPSQEDLACVGITLDTNSVVFEKPGDAKLLNVIVEPHDTTDTISFTSSDDTIATINEDGKITAVGSGSATITVACGNIKAECVVTCSFTEGSSVETTDEPTEATTVNTTPVESELRLNRKDITFASAGDGWVLYSGTIAKNLITWSSDDESVATFIDGKVVAVGGGTTEVHAEYEGVKVSCIIRCNFKVNNGVSGNGGGVTEDGGDISEDGGNTSENAGAGSCTIYTQYGNKASDITIKVNESVSLVLKDAAGNLLNVSWSTSGSGCALSGNTVTGTVSGTVNTIKTVYNGTTYSCTIRVK